MTASLFTATAAPPQTAPAKAESISIETKDLALVFQVTPAKRLLFDRIGARPLTAGAPAPFGDDYAYPTGGGVYAQQPALRVTHADGNTSTELVVSGVETKKLSDDVSLTTIHLKDEFYPLTVDLCIKSYARENVFEQWSEIHNGESAPVTLWDFASASFVFHQKSYWLGHFFGNWGKEMQFVENQLFNGITAIDSKTGVQSSILRMPHFFLSLNGKSTETSGDVLAGTLAWSGNYQLSFEVESDNKLRIFAGINPYASQYQLASGEVFKTPALIFTFSDHGKGVASRRIQRWALNDGMPHGKDLEPVLLNNWEATGFQFDAKKLTSLFPGAKALGMELFLLDDGWFGNGKNARINDKAGLGDWVANRERFPKGLAPVIDACEKEGMKFGIWMEPEMVNPASDLYEKHPDWVIEQPHRALDFGRNQLVLDLTNPAVRQYVFDSVDHLLTANPRIAYIKWDCNRWFTNAGSNYLPKDKQSQLWIDYTHALYSIADRLTKKYPNVIFMACSAGGGRVDYGFLKDFQEFWPSDNTDPHQRVFIQWGYSYFFPAKAVSAHVTHWGKHPWKFRLDVSMSARLGFDLDPAHLTPEEAAMTQQAIALYKNKLRPIVQLGDLYRLESPYEGKRAAISYVAENQAKAVLFAYQMEDDANSEHEPIKLAGLDPARSYRIEEVNLEPNQASQCAENGKTLTGKELMEEGIHPHLAKRDDSAVFLLEAQ